MLVDVIVPTYKRGSILREALESVKKQTYTQWTCWIAEDGASQKTYDTVKDFLTDDRFRYIPGKHLGAPAGPRNRGMRNGSGKYVAFLDDDDIWLPEKLEWQVRFFEKHSESVLVGTNGYRWNPNKKFDKKNTPQYFSKSKYWGKPIPYSAMFEINHFIASSVMLRREVLRESGIFNEELKLKSAEDYELWLRIGVLGEVWNLKEPLLVYRLTPPTFYNQLNKEDDYKFKAYVLSLALNGTPERPSPLQLPEKSQYAKYCRDEMEFCQKGPRFLGRIRHKLEKAIKRVIPVAG